MGFLSMLGFLGGPLGATGGFAKTLGTIGKIGSVGAMMGANGQQPGIQRMGDRNHVDPQSLIKEFNFQPTAPALTEANGKLMNQNNTIPSNNNLNELNDEEQMKRLQEELRKMGIFR